MIYYVIAMALFRTVSAREVLRSLFHRMSNLAAKVSREDAWPEFRKQARAACQAPSRAIARNLAADLVWQREKEFPDAAACFRDDFEACIAHLRMPVRHRKAVRTTNLPERLFGEERRRLKVFPDAWGEGGAQADVPGHEPGLGEVAVGQGDQLRAAPDEADREGTGRGMRKGKRTGQKPENGSMPLQIIQQIPDLADEEGNSMVVTVTVSVYLHRCCFAKCGIYSITS